MVILPSPAGRPEVDSVWECQVDIFAEVVEVEFRVYVENTCYGCRGEVGVHIATEEGWEVGCEQYAV